MTAEGGFPPLSNRGGNIEGTRTNVLVDWVSVSMPLAASMDRGVGEFLKEVRRLFDGTVCEFRDRGHGLHGYHFSVVSDYGGIVVAWGGNNNTVFLQIPGDGCSRVACFSSLQEFIHQRNGHLTRIDLAFDEFEGLNDLDCAVSLYRSGAFCAAAGGARSGSTRVSCSQAGNWIEPDGRGRTLYIGKAKHGKMLRVYEKGRQLGDSTSPWVRWEVQLTNRDRAIPLEALVEPGPFARGAYPALAFIGGPECRIATRRVAQRISIEKLSEHARAAYGPLLDVLRKSGVAASDLVERLRRDAIPRRLHAATDAEIVARCNALAADAAIDECVA